MIRNILTRLVLYPTCILLFILAFKMVFDPRYDKDSIYYGRSVFFGAAGMVMVLIYPVSDIAILIRDYRKKKRNSK